MGISLLFSGVIKGEEGGGGMGAENLEIRGQIPFNTILFLPSILTRLALLEEIVECRSELLKFIFGDAETT